MAYPRASRALCLLRLVAAGGRPSTDSPRTALPSEMIASFPLGKPPRWSPTDGIVARLPNGIRLCVASCPLRRCGVLGVDRFSCCLGRRNLLLFLCLRRSVGARVRRPSPRRQHRCHCPRPDSAAAAWSRSVRRGSSLRTRARSRALELDGLGLCDEALQARRNLQLCMKDDPRICSCPARPGIP